VSATDAFGDFRFPQIAVITGGRVSGGAFAAQEIFVVGQIVAITDSQQFKLQVRKDSIKTRRGNPAKVQEGSERFEASDSSKIALDPHPSDPTNPYVTRARAVGPVTADPDTGEEHLVKVGFSADVDLDPDQEDGSGVKRVELASIQVAVQAGEASVAEASVSELEEQPELEPAPSGSD